MKLKNLIKATSELILKTAKLTYKTIPSPKRLC